MAIQRTMGLLSEWRVGACFDYCPNPLANRRNLITGRAFFLLPKTVKEEVNMAGRKHLRGASKREQRQYEHIKKSAQKSGRYDKRAKEVAARTVVKRHKKKRRKKAK